MDPGFQLTPAEKHTEIGVFGCLSVCCLISCKSCSIIILLLLSALPVLVGSPDHSVSVVQRYVVGLADLAVMGSITSLRVIRHLGLLSLPSLRGR